MSAPTSGPTDGPAPLPGALLAALADLVLPLGCAGCGLAGQRWCAACRAAFGHAGTRMVPGLPPVVVLAPYTGPARAAVLAYKERGRRDLAVPLAAAVAVALRTTRWCPGVRGPVALVPAPSRRSAARARGGDHMAHLARAVARSPGTGHDLELARALSLAPGARDSVGLGPAERAGNLARHLRVRPRHLPPAGTPVLLLDDVLTTGATARAATAALRRAGCPVVAVVVLTAAPRHRQRNAVRGFTRPDQTARPPPSVRVVIRSGETGERHLPAARRSHYRGAPHFTRDGRCARSDPAAPGAPRGGVRSSSRARPRRESLSREVVVEIVLCGRNVEVPQHFREHTADKLSRVERYDHKIIRVDVELSHEPNPRRAKNCQRVEITGRGRGPVVRGEACASDFYCALDQAMARLEARLRRAHDRRRVHRGRRAPISLARAAGNPGSVAAGTSTVVTAASATALLDDGPRTAPEVTAPEVTAPEVTAPEITVPEDTVPAPSIPAARTPLDDRPAGRAPGDLLGDLPDGLPDDPTAWDPPEDDDQPEPGRIARRKEHHAVPMSVDDALSQMELVGHDFFLFADAASGRPSVVYRRHGYDYGVIALA